MCTLQRTCLSKSGFYDVFWRIRCTVEFVTSLRGVQTWVFSKVAFNNFVYITPYLKLQFSADTDRVSCSAENLNNDQAVTFAQSVKVQWSIFKTKSRKV
jgi:hypothetical protein